MNGTRYNNAGWAALNTSDDTVAVSKPTNKENFTVTEILIGICIKIYKIEHKINEVMYLIRSKNKQNWMLKNTNRSNTEIQMLEEKFSILTVQI